MTDSTPEVPAEETPSNVSDINTAKSKQKAQPVRNTQVILTVIGALVTILSGVNWADNPSWQSILNTVISGGLTVATTYLAKYLPTQVVPLEDASVYVDENGQSVAGPASPLPNGTPAKSAPKAAA